MLCKSKSSIASYNKKSFKKNDITVSSKKLFNYHNKRKVKLNKDLTIIFNKNSTRPF